MELEFLPIGDAAAFVGVDTTTLADYADDGRITAYRPLVRIDGERHFAVSDLAQLRKARELGLLPEKR
jgi:hypothetical protein